MSVSVTGLDKAWVEAKEADHFTPPGASASSEGFEIAPGEGPNPAPVTAENVAQPGHDGIPLLLAAEDRVGQYVDDRGREHEMAADHSNESRSA